jgi:predicted kinase
VLSFGDFMPTCYQLVGVPGSGKSTWIKNQDWTHHCRIISTDNYVEEYAQSQGKTYNEVFQDYMATAVERMMEDVIEARSMGQNIIWDQTSITIVSRKRKFKMLPQYDHIAVVFLTPKPEELARRLNSRPGKNIPQYVMDQMLRNFQTPTEKEGFKEVWLGK